MTTLERLAKLACETTLTKLGRGRPNTWEDQSPQRKEIWLAATRAVVEGMLELPEEIQGVVRKSSGYPTGYGMYQAAIRAILEESHELARRRLPRVPHYNNDYGRCCDDPLLAIPGASEMTIYFNRTDNAPDEPQLTILTITNDGRLVKGPGWREDDESSNEVFNLLSKAFSSWLCNMRARAEQAEEDLTRLRAKIEELK